MNNNRNITLRAPATILLVLLLAQTGIAQKLERDNSISPLLKTHEWIEKYSFGAPDSARLHRSRLAFNAKDDYCLYGILPDTSTTNCFYRQTGFSYDRKQKVIELDKSTESPYGKSNPLLGAFPGPCILLGRGLSFLDAIKVTKEHDSLIDISGQRLYEPGKELEVEGTLDTQNHLVLRRLKTFYNHQLMTEWICNKTTSASNSAICTESLLKEYNRGKLISSRSIQIANYRFGTSQALDLLNDVPRKAIFDNRFEESVYYEKLANRVNLDELTRTSQKTAKMQRAMLDKRLQNELMISIRNVIGGVVAFASGLLAILLYRRWRRRV